MTRQEIIRFDGVEKYYRMDKVKVPALQSIDLSIGESEFIVLSGPSGCGKSTLLNLIGCMDKASQGSVWIDGEKVEDMSEKNLNRIRRQKLGFIFQSFNLLPVLSAYQNVEFPLLLQKNLKSSERHGRVTEMLDAVGLGQFHHHKANALSGGQRQRVAIARALVTRPRLVVADEPTANLDSINSRNILDLMRKMHEEMGTTFVFSTHDPLVVSYAKRVIQMKDGQVIDDRGGQPVC